MTIHLFCLPLSTQFLLKYKKRNIDTHKATYVLAEDIVGSSNNYRIIINSINPLHPNISMHILLTVLHTFLEVMIGGIVFNNQQRLQLVIISFIFMSSYCMTRG